MPAAPTSPTCSAAGTRRAGSTRRAPSSTATCGPAATRHRAVAALGHALLTEDAEFHWFQTYEAAVRQFHAWPAGSEEGALILAGAARFLAAHTPTRRELSQVVRIATRLRRGEALFEDALAECRHAGADRRRFSGWDETVRSGSGGVRCPVLSLVQGRGCRRSVRLVGLVAGLSLCLATVGLLPPGGTGAAAAQPVDITAVLNYAPVVHLHPDEVYLPMRPDRFIEIVAPALVAQRVPGA